MKPKKNRPHVSALERKNLPMILTFILPVAIVYTILFIYPSARAFYVSLQDWNGFTSQMHFIGMANFRELMHDSLFLQSIRLTFYYMLIGGVLVIGLALFLSALLATNIKGKKFLRAGIFFPAVINVVAIAILWIFIYNAKFGLLNNILISIGLERFIQSWTSDANISKAMLPILVWTYCGYFCVILLSGLDRVPPDLVEAARIDGAGEIKIFFKVKLPLIKNILGTAVILWIIDCIKEFGLFFAWNGSGAAPQLGLTNMAVRMYITAFGKRNTTFRMGYATAMGVVMFLLVGILVPLAYSIFNKDKYEY